MSLVQESIVVIPIADDFRWRMVVREPGRLTSLALIRPGAANGPRISDTCSALLMKKAWQQFSYPFMLKPIKIADQRSGRQED